MIFTLVVPDWRPALLNELVGRHPHAIGRLKKADRNIVALYAHAQEIPKAVSKRRVSLRIFAKKHGRCPDPDAPFKSLLDSLVQCGLLTDDNAAGVELGKFEWVAWGKHKEQPRSEITLEDIEE